MGEFYGGLFSFFFVFSLFSYFQIPALFPFLPVFFSLGALRSLFLSDHSFISGYLLTVSLYNFFYIFFFLTYPTNQNKTDEDVKNYNYKINIICLDCIKKYFVKKYIYLKI